MAAGAVFSSSTASWHAASTAIIGPGSSIRSHRASGAKGLVLAGATLYDPPDTAAHVWLRLSNELGGDSHQTYISQAQDPREPQMLEFTRSVPSMNLAIGRNLAQYLVGRVLRSRLGPRISDRPAVYLSHFVVHGRLPNLREQRTFSERIAFRRLCPQAIFTPLSDKFEARGYVKDRVGEAYLVPLHAVTSEPEHFPFEDSLPRSYMMKANHGCGWNEVVLNSAQADVGSSCESAILARPEFRTAQARTSLQQYPAKDHVRNAAAGQWTRA